MLDIRAVSIETTRKNVILSKRSASKDLRTDSVLYGIDSAQILRLRFSAQDDRLVRFFAVFSRSIWIKLREGQ